MGSVLFTAFIYLFAAVVAVPLSKRLGLGSVLGYLLAGMIIGPALGLVGRETQEIQHVAEFGVVMMLFLVGLELAPGMLWRLRNKLLGLGGLQVGATVAVIALAAMALGQPWQVAVAAGCILALSSTAIVLQTLGEKKPARQPRRAGKLFGVAVSRYCRHSDAGAVAAPGHAGIARTGAWRKRACRSEFTHRHE